MVSKTKNKTTVKFPVKKLHPGFYFLSINCIFPL